MAVKKNSGNKSIPTIRAIDVTGKVTGVGVILSASKLERAVAELEEQDLHVEIFEKKN